MTIQYLLYKMVKSTPSGGQNECRTPAIIIVVVQQFQVTGGLYSDSTVPMFGMLTLSIISKRYEL